MMVVVEKPETTTSREFEIDQNIEALIAAEIQRAQQDSAGRIEPEVLKEIQQLMADRVQLLTPTITKFTFRRAG
jgi:hypothetical protein